MVDSSFTKYLAQNLAYAYFMHVLIINITLFESSVNLQDQVMIHYKELYNPRGTWHLEQLDLIWEIKFKHYKMQSYFCLL